MLPLGMRPSLEVGEAGEERSLRDKWDGGVGGDRGDGEVFVM